VAAWGASTACDVPGATCATNPAPVPASVSATQTNQIPGPVFAYAHALARLRAENGRSSIESFYALGRAVADTLVVRREDDPRGNDWLETFDDSTLAKVASLMEGFALNRNEDFIDAHAEPAFFLALAQAKGDVADVDYFRALGATYSAGLPSYVETTGMFGCTRYGDSTLVRDYASWERFRARHPRRYAGWVREAADDAERELTVGDCSCGTREDLLRELRYFAKRFPSARVTPRVRARLEGIESGRMRVREHCTGG
jgi:hypothetical protein